MGSAPRMKDEFIDSLSFAPPDSDSFLRLPNCEVRSANPRLRDTFLAPTRSLSDFESYDSRYSCISLPEYDVSAACLKPKRLFGQVIKPISQKHYQISNWRSNEDALAQRCY